MLNALHSQSGVTAVELMIGLVIAAILLAIGAPSLGDWIQNTRIHTSAESIVNGLQLARAEAVRRNAQVQFALVGTDTGWTVGCVVPDGTNCPAAIQSRTSAEGSTQGMLAVPLEWDPVTNAAPGTAVFSGTLIFNGLGRIMATTLAAGNYALIDISKPNADSSIDDCQPAGRLRCLRIVVSSGGQTRMCNPALPASNPQGC